MALHCPFCDGKSTAAIGLVAYADNVVVEHKCGSCGRLFSITDRRNSAQRLWSSSKNSSDRLSGSSDADASSSYAAAAADGSYQSETLKHLRRFN